MKKITSAAGLILCGVIAVIATNTLIIPRLVAQNNADATKGGRGIQVGPELPLPKNQGITGTGSIGPVKLNLQGRKLHVTETFEARSATEGIAYAYHVQIYTDGTQQNVFEQRYGLKSAKPVKAHTHHKMTLDEEIDVSKLAPGIYWIAVRIYERPRDFTVEQMLDAEAKGRNFRMRPIGKKFEIK